MKLYQLAAGRHVPEVLHAVIEVPKNSSNKYEYDPEFDIMRLDRVLYSAMHYPGDYGFIPSTLAEDGDRLAEVQVGGQDGVEGDGADAREDAAVQIPPAAVAWALIERGRWSTVVMGVASFAIAVMV